MDKKLFFRGTLATVACMSLSACFGSSGGGGTAAGGAGGGAGGGGQPPADEYQSNLTRVQNLGPQTVRQVGQHTYVGKTRLETASNANSTGSGFFIGDVQFTADFDSGDLSGTATNFEGEVDGQAVSLTGTLDTTNTGDPNVVVQQDSQLPAIAGGGTITTGSLIASMRGTLTESVNQGSSDAQLGLTGSFLGTNAEGASGAATMLLGNPGQVGVVIGGGGTFYADRQ